MNPKPFLIGKPLAWLLTLVYFTSYVTRINFAAVLQEVVTDTGLEKTALSAVLVCMSITYGLGQIVNGKLGDRIRPTTMILCGLITATTINLLFPLCSASIPLMSVLWGLNGLAHAMLWPPMVKLLVLNSDESTYSYSVVRISWGSSFGTVAVYLTAPFVIGWMGWKGMFFLSASVGVITTVVWLLLHSRIPESNGNHPFPSPPEEARARIPRQVLLPLTLIMLAIVLQGMLRDGVTSWMPTYLAEVFQLGNRASIFCTVSLAIFSIIAFGVAGIVYHKCFKNEVTFAGVIFAIASLGAIALFVFFQSGAVLSIFLMALITGCMHGVNLMLITHVPKRFKRYGNISTVSGVINSFTYVGAAISTYGIALLAERFGWRITVGVWAIIAILGTACCFLITRKWNTFIDEDKRK